MTAATTFRRTPRGYDIYHNGVIVGSLHRAADYDRHHGKTVAGSPGWELQLDYNGHWRLINTESFARAKKLASATLLAFDLQFMEVIP